MSDKKSVYFFMLVLEIPLLKTSMDIFLSVLYACLLYNIYFIYLHYNIIIYSCHVDISRILYTPFL